MVKKLTFLLCGFLSVVLFAQDTTDEIVYRESKRLKAAGITTLVLGTGTIAAGTVTLVSKPAAGGYVAGGLICAFGVGIDLLAIPIFKHRKQLVEQARQNTKISLIAKPNGLSFVAAF